jgi:Icc-related predicted phosphoesterase
MKILAVSDQVKQLLYGPNLERYASGVEAVISCGDLPFEYLEYIVTFLGAPVYYVLGNHDPGPDGKEHPGGCIPLDGRVVDIGGVAVAGLSGSLLYSGGPNQYTQRAMGLRALRLSAGISCRRMLGRPAPRIFVSHAPPFGMGDREDLCHTGFASYLRLIDRYRPELWLHGHVHLYGAEPQRVVRRGGTRVVNVFGHRIVEV